MSQLVRELLEAGAPLDGVERLLGQWGGTPLYVPQAVSAEHAIARVAGLATAAALVSRYAGLRPVLPLGASLRRERLRHDVLALKAAGLNHVEIARRLGLHLRQVQRLAVATADDTLSEAAEADDNQLELPL